MIWALPNKGLEWTSAVPVERASARSPLNPVLSRLRWWNNMESSFEGQAAVTALAFLAGGDAGNRLALLPGRLSFASCEHSRSEDLAKAKRRASLRLSPGTATRPSMKLPLVIEWTCRG